MTLATEKLDPPTVWKHFLALAAIPRSSRNEAGARAYVLEVAGRLGLPAQVDAAGNVVVRKAGSKGREAEAPVVLQGHLDMVCEKNSGTAHDFSRDPIRVVADGDEWVKADG